MNRTLENELIPLGLNCDLNMQVKRSREQELALNIHQLSCEVGVLIENHDNGFASERVGLLQAAVSELASLISK